MLDRSVIEGGSSKSVKRPHDTDEVQDASPPKIFTPQTRAQVKSMTANICTPTQKSPGVELESLVTRTQISGNKSVSCQGSKSSAKKTKSNIPVVSEVRITRRRSRSNTPVSVKTLVSVTRSSRNNTPLSAKQKASKDVTSDIRQTDVQSLIQHTQTRSKQKKLEEEKSPRRSKVRDRNSPKCDQTPRIPHSTILPKGRILDRATPEKSSDKSRYLVDAEKQSQGNSRSVQKVNCDVQDEHVNPPCVPGHEQIEVLSENSPPTSGVQPASSQTKNENQSSVDTSGYECSEEIKNEVEKVKKRRSTLGQRMSRQSICERKSLCSVLPMLSFEDQISSIDSGLPQTSKVGHLVDICLRETMRRIGDHCNMEDCFPDMRLELITNSESIGGHTAYKIAGLPLEADNSLLNKGKGVGSFNSDKVTDMKTKTKKLEEEYKSWKSLLKERKLACQSAEREFREAKSGETKIDDECMKTLTSLQKNILQSKPNYNQYMEEIKMAYEKTFFVMQEINHTASIVSSFTSALKVVGDSCYSAVEEMTFGTMKCQPLKSTLNSLLALEDVPST
ncbi:THO complex subunit 2-like [Macrobrachium rosenbergii]|uniref:THO complex subunit 2-like n=1 Tax=Macrobrachium rosenbergii TaxID=79674 RepID=UPI0034D49D55